MNYIYTTDLMEFLDLIFTAENIKLLLAAGLGALIGLERELSGKDPSLRTFTLICLGSCIFSIISIDSAYGRTMADPGRIAAQVVTGIGFLGAGAIFRSTKRVAGLTTAALMWVTASIGMAVGFGKTELAITATFISLFVIFFLKAVHKIIRRFRPQLYADQTDYD